MSAVLSGLIPYIIAAVGAFGFLVAAYARGHSAGTQSERAKQTAAAKKAVDESNEIQNDVGAMSPSDARKEMGKWSHG